MEMNYDPTYPDCPTVDQCLWIWSQHVAFRDKPVFQWINKACQVTGSLSYGELNSAAEAVSTHLLNAEKLKHGDRVILLYPPGLDFISVLFGCQRAGIVVIPLMPPMLQNAKKKKSSKDLKQIVEETSAVAVLAPSSCMESIMELLERSRCGFLRIIAVNDDDAPEVKEEEDGRRRSSSYIGCCKAEDLYLIQYTSGATGPPKPTMITAGAAAHNARAARSAFDLQPSSVIVSWLPQYHDCGLMFLLLTISCGATCILASPFDFAQRPSLWIEMLSKFRGSCTVVPSFALTLLSSKFFFDNTQQQKGPQQLLLDLSYLRNLILINEPILAEEVMRFVTKFSQFGLRAAAIAPAYGLAENCTFVSTAWSPNGNGIYREHQGLMPSGRIASSQDALLEMDIRIVDPASSEEVPDGEEGEVWVASPSMGAGYLHDPQLSGEVFAAEIRNRRELEHHPCWRGFLRTGDTGVILDGYLFVTGRMQDVILVANNNGRKASIHPQHIEATTFRSSPLLRAGCTVAFQSSTTDDEQQGNVGVVVVAEVANPSLKSARGLAESICLRLFYKHDLRVSTVALVKPLTIPKTTSGKLRRSETKKMFLAGELDCIQRVSFNASSSETAIFASDIDVIELRSAL